MKIKSIHRKNIVSHHGGVVRNREKPWMRRYNFKIIRKINRLRHPTKNRKYFIKNAKSIPQNKFKTSNTKLPTKIHLNKNIKISIPHKLQATIHSDIQLDYQGQNKFLLLPVEDILNFSGEAKISIPQMKLNPQEIQIPKMVAQTFETIHQINLWFYMSQRISNWHYDGHDNFLYMLQGLKTVYLADPESIKSRQVFSLFNNHAQQPIEIKKKTGILRAVIHAKQCLYIPRGWWHKVISSGTPNIGINFWGNSLTRILDIETSDKKLLLKQLLFQEIEKKCTNQIEIWQKLQENQKQKIRKDVGMLIFSAGFQ